MTSKPPTLSDALYMVRDWHTPRPGYPSTVAPWVIRVGKRKFAVGTNGFAVGYCPVATGTKPGIALDNGTVLPVTVPASIVDGVTRAMEQTAAYTTTLPESLWRRALSVARKLCPAPETWDMSHNIGVGMTWDEVDADVFVRVDGATAPPLRQNCVIVAPHYIVRIGERFGPVTVATGRDEQRSAPVHVERAYGGGVIIMPIRGDL